MQSIEAEGLEIGGARLDRLARETPEMMAVAFVDGPEWTWTELRQRVHERAAGLQSLGVRQDDFVLSWMPNGPVAAVNLLALNQLGAIYVPINTGYRGALLAHVIANSGATLMIAHGELVERLQHVDLAKLATVVVVGEERPALPGVRILGAETLEGDAAKLRSPERPVAVWDTQMVIYTSGTTGASKGVLTSYRHARRAAIEFRNMGPGDRILTTMPLFHVGGVYGLLQPLYLGATAILANSFRTQQFWPIVRRYRVTTTGLPGSMADFLNALPESPDDREHGLESVVIAPYGPAAIRFRERFGVEVYTEYSMTELSVPLFVGPNPSLSGICGRVRAGVDLRLVDTHDMSVPQGSAGELILRTAEPWEISHGYHNDPAATAAAWRNGWFHTGDMFRRDAEGNYFFVDRAKDAVRRRGENISSFEVESAIKLHPDVAEAAVVGVPADAGTEEEVLAIVVPAPGRILDPAQLIAYLVPRLAPFMVPRYIRQVSDFPRTPTEKIEKHKLRGEGVTADTWDRVRAGIEIRRDKLESRG
jgi:carnitine-CoA ligase